MPNPQPVQIELDTDTQKALEALTRRHSTPQQIVMRARVILLAADGMNKKVRRTSRAVSCGRILRETATKA